MTSKDPFTRIHLPAYIIVASASLFIATRPSPLQALITSLILVGVTVNIELLATGRYESFDPNHLLTSIILLVYGLQSYTGIDRSYILLLALATSSILISASYWEEEGYSRPYTILLPIAVFTAPLAGILAGGRHPFLYTLLSMLETSILYGIQTWETSDWSKLAAHLASAAALYSLAYKATGDLAVAVLLSATYFIKYILSNWNKPGEIYPSIDPYIKVVLEGLVG